MTTQEARAALDAALSDSTLSPMKRLRKVVDIALELFTEERARRSKQDDSE